MVCDTVHMDPSPVEVESGWPRVPGACFAVLPRLPKFPTGVPVLGEPALELRLMLVVPEQPAFPLCLNWWFQL